LQPRWQDIFSGNKYIRRLVPYHSKWYYQLPILSKLRQTKYNHVLIFHANKNIGRILPWLRCKSIWSHQSTNTLPSLSENQIIQINKPVHGILRRIAMLEKIKAPEDGTHMDIFLKEKDKADSILFLKENRMVPKEFIYMNIGGSSFQKQWPVDKFVSLAQLILKNTSMSIILGGGPEAADRVSMIENEIGLKRVTRATHLPLKKSCSLISQARILISPDSGPMHIGFALKVPTIALFWSSDSAGTTTRNPLNGPDYCGPLNIDESLYAVLYGNFFTETKNENYPENSFLKPILVSEVWEKILYFMKI
jgi:ADP-heptose:LPS heptosyltransferase